MGTDDVAEILKKMDEARKKIAVLLHITDKEITPPPDFRELKEIMDGELHRIQDMLVS